MTDSSAASKTKERRDTDSESEQNYPRGSKVKKGGEVESSTLSTLTFQAVPVLY